MSANGAGTVGCRTYCQVRCFNLIDTAETLIFLLNQSIFNNQVLNLYM